MCTHACMCQGEGWEGEKGRAACCADFTNTGMYRAQQTQELFVTYGTIKKEIFAGIK